jgi:homoserine dehydrogenase
MGKMVNIAILGHGTVGSGVAELLHKNGESIARKAGEEIVVKRILDLRDFPESPCAEKFTKDFADIAGDPEIKAVVEAMGGVTPACDFIRAALSSGKSVVTSNKELVAEKGAELLALAAENGVNFLFEASVGGGIPIIRPLSQCLAANEIDEIAGILNGTTNFILTKMFKENMAFSEALELAKRLGYAEADPSADVDGHDACRKICILASLAFGSQIHPQDVPTEGIGGITPEDVAYAADAGRVIKLIAQTRRPDSSGKAFALVSPALVSEESQLSGVDDVFNAILVRGDATGEVVFYGKGAGKLPTASAVIGDVIECVKAAGNIGALKWSDNGLGNVADTKAAEAAFYVRGLGDTAMALTLGEIKFLARPSQPEGELAFIAPPMPERELEGLLHTSGLKTIAKIRLL